MRNQNEILELKSTVTEIKNVMEYKDRFEQAEKRISKLDWTVVIIETDEQNEKRLNESEQSLRNLWDAIKQSSRWTYAFGSPRIRRERWREYLNNGWKLTKFDEDMDINIQRLNNLQVRWS